MLSHLKKTAFGSLLVVLFASLTLQAQSMPRLEQKDGRFALVVDGKPFLMLGAQLNNSSAWAGTLPHAWDTLAALHANTVEAPVYWEQMEPVPGTYDFAGVDLLITQARAHHLHVVLLWFGTWKNGQNHYVPEWMKRDVKTYPREVSARGKLLDVMSPHSAANLDADKHAFAALMRHVREMDAQQGTVIMVQVENETGSVGAVRDYSAAADRVFAGEVPAELAAGLHVPRGTWAKTFGADADEKFAAWFTARYVGEVAKAGKAEYALPMYCNVWITYPVHALENRDLPRPGQDYPSGGPQQQNVEIWKIAAPAVDALAPDVYSDDVPLYKAVLARYMRPDNALFVPETRLGASFGRFLFYALGSGAIGFAPFGIDQGGDVSGPAAANPNRTDWTLAGAQNYALLGSIGEQVARLNLDGKLQTAVEERGAERQVLRFGDVEAVLSFGFPQSDGATPPGTAEKQGRGLVAEVASGEFLVTGFEVSVSFRLIANGKDQLEILRAEEGRYVDGVWRMDRILNGDETDRGLNFRGGSPGVVRVRVQRIPLMGK